MIHCCCCWVGRKSQFDGPAREEPLSLLLYETVSQKIFVHNFPCTFLGLYHCRSSGGSKQEIAHLSFISMDRLFLHGGKAVCPDVRKHHSESTN